MPKQGDASCQVPSSGSDVTRFLPFTDAATGRLNWPLPAPERTKIITLNETLFPLTSSLLAITANGKHQHIHLIKPNGEVKPQMLIVRASMDYFDELLFPYGFVRVHNGAIINIFHLEKRRGNQLLLTHTIDEDLQVSAGFAPLLEKAISIFLEL
jgi:DNA-binding LytR/AlgR family response regulator